MRPQEHWTARYVGKAYVKDVLDCGGWAERILHEQFGRDVELPKERAQGLRPRSRQVAENIDLYAERVVTPKEGDGVLMVTRGDLYHIGIFVMHREPLVLHAMEGFGAVVLHRIRDLAGLSIRLEGYYRWK